MEGNVAKYRSAQHHDDTELIDVEWFCAFLFIYEEIGFLCW